MSKSKQEKAKQLGMNPSTASARLKKEILFSLVKELGKDKCFHCGDTIHKLEEFSIEHKIPWLHSDNPKELYFGLDNIAYSHISCNISASRMPIGFINNSDKIKGWYKVKNRENSYRAEFRYKGEIYRIGEYKTPEEAREAYLKKKEEVLNR